MTRAVCMILGGGAFAPLKSSDMLALYKLEYYYYYYYYIGIGTFLITWTDFLAFVVDPR